MTTRNGWTGGTLALLLAIGLGGCGGGTELETRTFELRYLSPHEASEIVAPYVYGDRPDAPGAISDFRGGITVRETGDNLEKISRVLERFDRLQPAVRLRFQVIEADGEAGEDPRIQEVEAVLRRLFRFEGYRLLAESQLGTTEGASASQVFSSESGRFRVRVRATRIRWSGDAGSVDMEVQLNAEDHGPIIESSVTVPTGQTVVIGSSRPDPDRGALILTVRPTLVETGGEGETGVTDGGTGG